MDGFEDEHDDEGGLIKRTTVRTRTIKAISLASILLFGGCATQTTVAPGPLGEAQTKLAEARSLKLPTEARITDYFEAAEVAENEAIRQSRDTAAKQQAEQIYNDASAEVTVLLKEADGGKYWNHAERIGVEKRRATKISIRVGMRTFADEGAGRGGRAGEAKTRGGGLATT